MLKKKKKKKKTKSQSQTSCQLLFTTVIISSVYFVHVLRTRNFRIQNFHVANAHTCLFVGIIMIFFRIEIICGVKAEFSLTMISEIVWIDFYYAIVIRNIFFYRLSIKTFSKYRKKYMYFSLLQHFDFDIHKDIVAFKNIQTQ